MPKPGDPGYVSIEEATRQELARRAAYEARPDIIAKRKADREWEERKALEKAARRNKVVANTDYPWLKPDWDWDKVPLGFAKRPPTPPG